MARSQRSRRRTQNQPSSGGKKRPRTVAALDLAAYDDGSDQDDDEHIDSGDEDELDDVFGGGGGRGEPSLDSDDEESMNNEPIEAKRVRLAKEYLQKIDSAGSDSDSSSTDESSAAAEQEQADRIGDKLRRERQKKEGTYERLIADKVHRYVVSTSAAAAAAASTSDLVEYLPRCHDLTLTSVAMSGERRAVSGSKDHSVVLWDLENHTKITSLCQKWSKNNKNTDTKQQTTYNKNQNYRTAGQVLCVACSDDERYAAVGRRDATVQIYDIRAKGGGYSSNLVKTFEGHKGPVTSLAFRSHALQLFSGSSDRCIRHYNLDEMLYLETLYGHQFGVSGIDCNRKELPISVGEDRTARAWKLSEDSHLIFRGGGKVQAADCITVIRDDWFLTGHRDGNLSLWYTDKKRAVSSIGNAHGVDTVSNVGRNVVSVASLKLSDLAATGSDDGYLRLWKIRTGKTLSERGIDRLCEIPLKGYVNSIAFGPKAKFCVCATGQEHRLGRWNRVAGAKNRLAIVKLRDNDHHRDAKEDDDDEDDDNINLQMKKGEVVGSDDEKSSSSSDGSSSSSK